MAITPVHPWHITHGGRMVDFAGTDLPVQFTSIVKEHQAVRTEVGWFDVSHMGRFSFTGPDCEKWLDQLVTCRLRDLQPGRVRYGLVCKEDGGILDDVLVYNLGGSPAKWAMVVNASNRAKIKAWFLNHNQGFQASLEDQTEVSAMIAVQGPQAIALGNQLFDRDPSNLPYYGSFEANYSGIGVLVSRTGYTGEDGWEVSLPAASALPLVERLDYLKVMACGLGARDTLRLEAAMPLYGHELSDSIDPFQAGLGRSVDLEMDIIGRDALLRRRGHADLPVRVGLSGSAKRAAREGDIILAEGGAEVGRVTSGTMSPTFNHPIAMAYLRPGFAALGQPVAAIVRGREEDFTIVKLPFYKRLGR